ncbi:hypothetical protein AAG570_002203 [Ranatra chinensis]|uniref:Inhibitor of growth protein n=1 Tax=Ranatra chinensis TaxID=642074 RepID=A0ABD0Y6V7_9HEMI
MRELDLQVQNSMDSLEKRVKIFFSNAKKMKPQDQEAEYEAIRKDYYKALEDADEKVQLANHMYELVAKYLRRLDQETHKFKMELEADNMGITEILEKRSHEMDTPPTNSCQKENRYSFSASQRMSHHEKRRDSGTVSLDHKRLEKILPELRVPPTRELMQVAQMPYNLGHIGAGGTAIAAAASQAIAATQQMQQGRRTASLKASYEAIHSGGGGGGGGGATIGGVGEISISKELAGAAQTAIAAIQDTHKKHKKKSGVISSSLSGMAPSPPDSVTAQSAASSASDRSSASNPDAYDPNEPRYCICNEVAFGTMVACDNKTCPYEWYHYPCVGITDKPKGKWYCPHCISAMKRRNRKN